jgi:uncharacterized protein YcgI (DUF1989 family)
MTASATIETVPARYGKAIRVPAGAAIRLVNTHGNQVVDTWAFRRDDLAEYMSMAHSRSVNSRIYPALGDVFVSIQRRPMLRLVEDSSPGRHDTLLCACNAAIYEEHGCAPGHRSCQDNLHEALAALGLAVPCTPAPLNIFMNVSVQPDGSILREPPVSRPGDHVLLRAEMDLVVVFSACPQDVTPINGAARTPRDVHYQIVGPSA